LTAGQSYWPTLSISNASGKASMRGMPGERANRRLHPSKFVIADITNPKSAPLELQATVPEIMVPFHPIMEEGEKPFAMLQHLWIKRREWVF
jgi:hypothetical protein